MRSFDFRTGLGR